MLYRIIIDRWERLPLQRRVKIMMALSAFCGAMMYAFMSMSMQDTYGLEGYIDLAREKWVYHTPAWGRNWAIVVAGCYWVILKILQRNVADKTYEVTDG